MIRLYPLKRTPEQFIQEVYNLVGDEYILLEDYRGTSAKVKAFHNVCGNEILITPKTFLFQNVRCSICNGGRKLTYNEVKNYVENTSDCTLLSTEYINYKSPIKLRCACNNLFETTFRGFKHDNKRQCNECGRNSSKERQRLDFEVVKHRIEVEGNCRLISTEYINNRTPLEIQCLQGHYFTKRLDDFNPETPCPKCSNLKKRELSHHSYSYVYNYIKRQGCQLLSTEYINNRTKLLILCENNHEFDMPFGSFRDGQRCPRCNESKGEKRIGEYLTSQRAVFQPQFTFDDCRGKKRPLPFDFAVFGKDGELSFIIEYDGGQHFEPIEHFGGERYFEITKRNDNIKNEYCKENNIKLLRIPYFDFDNIEEILFNYISKIE